MSVATVLVVLDGVVLDGVVLDGAATAAACLRAAGDAAAALAAPRIEALHIRMDPAGTLELPDVMTTRYEHAIEQRSTTEGAAIRAAFDAWRQSAPAADATWIEVAAIPAVAVRERGALAALIVMARPSQATHPADAAGFDAAVFDTGKPVLVVPPGAGAPFGRHLAVGWRDAPATRRSLEALRPWLMAAETVSVIAVSGDAVALPDDWCAANLPANATLHVVPPEGRSDGAALLHKAAELGADGLAIGAYRRGRLLERLLGGVTADVLRGAAIPVLTHV
jgi:nucleotide-binding universal stress UspA family protein